MKIRDIHIAFKTVMDKNSLAVAFGGCPAFLPEEIDLFLNQAYIEIITNKFTGSNGRTPSFELNVKRISDLEKLVKTDLNKEVVISSNALVMSNFFKDVDDKNSRLFFIEGAVNFKDGKANMNIVDHITAQRFKQTYNNTPWIQNPITVLEDNKLITYVDPISMLEPFSVDITYIKYPEIISYEKYDTDITEVTDDVMYEVINRAAVIALENIESQRTATKVQINLLSE